MSGPGATPTPWGDPARLYPATGHPPSDGAARMPAATAGAPARSEPVIGTASPRWEHPTPRERARAALTMIFVAIVLGAAAAAVLGIGVWVLAALFHHAASG